MRTRIRLHPVASLLAAGAIAGCSGGGSDSTPTSPTATTGSLAIAVSGLPTDRAPAVTVSGPNGYTATVAAAATLTGLAAGSYTVTPARVHDVGLDYAAAASTVAVAAGAPAAASVAYALRVLPRATANRTDETALARYHLMYVLPSDGVDRNLDTDGTIARTVSSWERWYVGQTSGRYLRLDASDGAPDITFYRLARTDAQMTSYGDFLRDTLEKDLRTAGQTGAANTLYLVYYDGGHATRCGSAALPPSLPGVVAAIYLKGLATGPVPCANNAFAATPSSVPGYLEFVAAHEALHLLGIVSSGAPNYIAGSHVGNDPTDLMYAGNQVWRPATLDLTKSNYYNATGLPSGLVNVAQSPYLATP